MSICPCGSKKDYADCCEAYHNGQAAPTAEALMRARYSAFEKGQLQFLSDSLTESSRKDYSAEETANWAGRAKWHKLVIVKTEAGQEADDHGVVEFQAHFKMDGRNQIHHERSRFTKEDGRWHYVDGEMNPAQQQRIVEHKLGRNDPCHCGSGKKFKKCCGA